jgi:hypothetical protein
MAFTTAMEPTLWLQQFEPWATWITAGATCLLAFGVLVAIIQLHALKRDRHLQWIGEIGRRWDEDKLERSRLALRKLDKGGDALAAKTRAWLDPKRPYDPELDEEMSDLSRLPDFLEDVAVMVRVGRLDIGPVWAVLSGPVNTAWKGWAKAIRVYRETGIDEEAYTEFEALRRKLRRYEHLRKRWWFRAWRWFRWYVW